ncbi:hypothetical protein D3C79_1109670 [compost metagenome]
MPRTAWFSELESSRETMMPTTCWLWLRMALADLLGTKPCSAMTRSTRSRVWGLTLGS